MRPPRVALAAAAAGLLAVAPVLATPAFADSPPTSAVCVTAQNKLNTDQVAARKAEDALAEDQTSGVTQTQLNQDQATISQDQATVGEDQAVVNIQCGGAGAPVADPGTPAPPDQVTVYRVIDGQKCERVGGVWVPVEATPAGYQEITYKVVNGKRCHWVSGSWVPVTPPVGVSAPCAPCTAAPAPPTEVVTTPAPLIVDTPPPPPAPGGPDFGQVGTPPAGAAPTGDGTLAAVVYPVPVIPGPVIVDLTVDLEDVLTLGNNPLPLR